MMSVVPPEDLSQEIYRLGRFVSYPKKSPVFIRNLVRAGFYPTGVNDTVKCFSCGCEIGNLKDNDEILERHKQASPTCSFVSRVHCTSQEQKVLTEPPRERVLLQNSCQRVFDPVSGIPTENTGMCSEEARLKTFVSWPRQGKPTIEELATAGLYYVGTDDRTQCFVCKGILRAWNPSDCPIDEHRRCFPSCRFVRGLDVGNIPLVSPHAPDKQQFDVRLATFVSWSKKANISASSLASAGFYYTGVADNVKCFFCDGGLRNWEIGDDPWHEHTKWFPRCGFVLQEKGQAYVRTVQSRYPNLMRVLLHKDTVVVIGYPCPVDQPEQLMKSTLVKCVLEMGFDRNFVHSTVHSKFLLTGIVYTSLEELINDLIAAEEDMNDQSVSYVSILLHKLTSQLRSCYMKWITDVFFFFFCFPTASSTEEELRRLQDERMCKVCMDQEVSVVFIPCGHLVVCFDCASSPSLRKCPICRSLVRGTLRTYMS
uniref:RING-type E3 ubiquitin transferase n=1 Tax=Eptatretus burgeri TaxID=7764 RepID=A0A8C4QH26_EPTBU